MRMKKLLPGALPPMITPFTENGDVDYAAFESNVAKWNDTDLTGYLVLGSNSETAFLSEKEKDELLKITASTASKDRYLMAGTSLEGLRETIRYTNKAAELGMDAALVLTPNYYDSAMNSKNLVKYFTALADASDIPILIYNVSKFTHVNIKPDAVAELCTHPNIIGMKDSQGDFVQLANFKRALGDNFGDKFNLIVGTASMYYPALQLGVKNAIMALANCCPNECGRMYRLFDEGKLDEGMELYMRMLPVNTAVTGTYGIAGLKYACDLLGYKGGYVRVPLLDSSDKDKAEIRAILEKAQLLG